MESHCKVLHKHRTLLAPKRAHGVQPLPYKHGDLSLSPMVLLNKAEHGGNPQDSLGFTSQSASPTEFQTIEEEKFLSLEEISKQ